MANPDGLTNSRYVLALLAVALLAAASSHAQLREPGEAAYARARELLVERYIERSVGGRKPVADEAVLGAMRSVLRHKFVPPTWRSAAYDDRPLPIGGGQTISQPYIVATMTEALRLDADDVVLEVGTGSGYQAAVLAEIVKQVYTIEIVPDLGKRAAGVLDRLGYSNVEVRIGDGYKGWPEHAPFDGIIVTAAPDHVPQPLIDQLKPGGRLVIPVGPQGRVQELKLLQKQPGGLIVEKTIDLVRFVPMTGEAQKKQKNR